MASKAGSVMRLSSALSPHLSGVRHRHGGFQASVVIWPVLLILLLPPSRASSTSFLTAGPPHSTPTSRLARGHRGHRNQETATNHTQLLSSNPGTQTGRMLTGRRADSRLEPPSSAPEGQTSRAGRHAEGRRTRGGQNQVPHSTSDRPHQGPQRTILLTSHWEEFCIDPKYLLMASDKSPVTETILNLTLDIIHLLTGEDYTVVKKNCSECVALDSISLSGQWIGMQYPITVSPLVNMENKEQKILELTSKIIHLLTGEVPIRYQDVTVYFSMVEWEYLEGHKDLYRDIMVESYQIPTLPDGSSSRNTPEKCPRLFYPQDCPVENRNIVQAAGGSKEKHQVVEITDGEKEICMTVRQVKGKDIPIVLSPERPLNVSSGCVGEVDKLTVDDFPRETNDTTDIPLVLPSIDASYDFSNPGVETQGADHMESETYPCSECGKCFTVRSSLIRHLKNHSGVKPFACIDCGKCFMRKSILVKHLRSHTGEKPFSCMQCGKCFMQKSNLTDHQRIHTGERPFSCPVCGKCFTYKSDFMKHQRIHTEEKPFSCSECGKCFTQKLGLVRHARIHAGEKPLLCLACGKMFARKSELVKHERIHTGEKPFLCSKCGKGFTQKSDLMRHQRVHTGEKPFPCTQCEKRFILKSELVKHMRNHTGEKPFSCFHCGKCFAWKSELVKHQRFHTGEKPFQCSECWKSFTQKSDLMRHQIVHLR